MATFEFLITSYDLSVYPCQPTTNTETQALAYMTLQGALNPGYQFVIYFYPDGTADLGAPNFDPQTNKVTMKMYYSQLAGLTDLLNLALLKNGPPCQAGYTDGPPLHVEIGIQVLQIG